jgi:NTE family protein
MLRVVDSQRRWCPAMVQRGYFTSISVLSALSSPQNSPHLYKVRSYCLLGTRVPSPALALFAILSLVTTDLHSRFRFAERLRLRSGIGLALGGGFARGYAHLGVLRELEEQQIPIACISGSSVGSILGAAYASGAPLANIMEKCREIRFRDFARWRVSRFGLASNDRLGALVYRFFDSRQFEDLTIPLAIVATDLGTGDPVVFRQGSLADAIRASCAFPGLFEPVQIGTRYLADGGLVAPVPTRATRELGAETVVGVCVGMHDGHRGAPANIFQVVSRAVSAAQKNQLEAWERHADLVLRPAVQSLAWDDFDRVDEAVEGGAAAARSAIPQIKRFLDSRIGRPFEADQRGEYLYAEALR